jgi:beta-lactam-binding protein with PASTA domain
MRKRSRKGGRVGIRKVTVPNLSGLTRLQAQSLLSSLGLNYLESTTNTSTLALTDGIASQGSAHSSTVSIGSTVPFVYYNYVDPVVITYGPCESYGTPSTIGSGTQCSGEFYEEYTDYSRF